MKLAEFIFRFNEDYPEGLEERDAWRGRLIQCMEEERREFEDMLLRPDAESVQYQVTRGKGFK